MKHSNEPDEHQNDWPHYVDPNKTTSAVDGFICEQGVAYAGKHWFLDLWGATHLDNLQHIERTLQAAVLASQSTLLHLHLHHFTPNGGVSGVAILAESHISIHTWPERAYAAVDIFMCGNTLPEKAVEKIEAALCPSQMDISRHRRGVVMPQLTPNNPE